MAVVVLSRSILFTLFGFPCGFVFSGLVLVLACQRRPTPHVQPPDQDVEVHGQSVVGHMWL